MTHEIHAHFLSHPHPATKGCYYSVPIAVCQQLMDTNPNLEFNLDTSSLTVLALRGKSAFPKYVQCIFITTGRNKLLDESVLDWVGVGSAALDVFKAGMQNVSTDFWHSTVLCIGPRKAKGIPSP
jgi:hypothetical protein